MDAPYATVVWATDGSGLARAALNEAVRLLPGARYYAVHCDQRLTGRAGEWPARADEDDVRGQIRKDIAALREDGLDITLTVRRSHRQPADVVAAVAARLDADAIVCGTRGHGPMADAFLGGFAHRLLHVARCPVLAVPSGVREPAGRHAKTEAYA